MPGFSHLLTDKIVVSRYTGRAQDAFGTEQYGSQETIRAAVSDGFLKVRDSNGNERVSSTQIIVENRIALEDRIWIVERGGDASLGDDVTSDDASRKPISIRYDRSRKSGTFLHQVFL